MKSKNRVLVAVEILVVGGLIFALVAPLFSPGEDNTGDEGFQRRLVKPQERLKAIAPYPRMLFWE
jgi:hypothetical protein